MKKITLEKDYSIKLSSNIVDYIYPEYIFLPMYNGFNLKVKNNECIKKEQIILENNEGISIYSSVSGRVVGAKDCILANGKIQKCVVVENDFKEKMVDRAVNRKSLKHIDKEKFYEILTEKRIPSFDNKELLLVDIFINNDFNKIVVNGIEDEPYIASKLFLLSHQMDEILETLSYLAKIFNTNENILIFVIVSNFVLFLSEI